MKQADIKTVTEQLGLYKVPVASIHYASEGSLVPPIKNSQEIIDMLRNNWEQGTIEAHESFYLVLLNRSNKVKGITLHSKGGLTGTVIDTRMILCAALLSLSCSIIVAHNHPSGNIQPSEADIKITHKLKQAATHMEITILDHVILTKDSYFSFADEGILN